MTAKSRSGLGHVGIDQSAGAGSAGVLLLSDDAQPACGVLLPWSDGLLPGTTVAEAFVRPFLIRRHLHIQRRCGRGRTEAEVPRAK